jgi:hypothetical protein
VEGEREVEGPPIESKFIPMPSKVNKFNIGIVENPNMANIGD